MDRSFVYKIVERECQQQDKKWGKQNHLTPDWNIIFGEEHGEACKAAIEGKQDELIAELIQCAALLIQWILCECDRKIDNDEEIMVVGKLIAHNKTGELK